MLIKLSIKFAYYKYKTLIIKRSFRPKKVLTVYNFLKPLWRMRIFPVLVVQLIEKQRNYKLECHLRNVPVFSLMIIILSVFQTSFMLSYLFYKRAKGTGHYVEVDLCLLIVWDDNGRRLAIGKYSAQQRVDIPIVEQCGYTS